MNVENAVNLNYMPYALPKCLVGRVVPEAYSRWLQRKAVALVKRDRGRGNKSATISGYKQAIHKAVIASAGCDAYTAKILIGPS